MDLNQVTIPVSNLDQSIAFYKKLGLHLIVYSKDHYARFECPGGATFSLSVVRQEISDHPAKVYFENERMDEEVTRLKSEGVVFDSDPADKGWAWREALLRDPDGNHLCIYWAGVNRRFPPWRIRDDTSEI